MDTAQPPATNSTMSNQDHGTQMKHIQMQPVETSGGRDLANDLVWQRDPDCSKDPVPGTVLPDPKGAMVTQTQMLPVNQTQVLSNQNSNVQVSQQGGFPMTTGTSVQPQQQIRYQFPNQASVIPNQSGDNTTATMVQSFQLPSSTGYSGPQQQGVAGYVPQTVLVDTDGIRIQQIPQNIPLQGYPVQQNMVPVQFNQNFTQGGNTATNSQFISMPPPATAGQHYQRLVPICQVNPQFLAVPRANFPSVTKPTSLNVTAANQANQNPSVVSPVMSPAVTSPGTESVKSPTYVFMCNKCSYVTPHRGSFKTHYSSHIQYKPYQCAYCDHATIMKQPMQKHVKMRHGIEDAEGFSYETDPKKENIIDFFCKQCRSTMSMEEAKKYLAKYESQTADKLKPGPSKRKSSLDDKDDDQLSGMKRKKKLSITEANIDAPTTTNVEQAHAQQVGSPRGKSPLSPRGKSPLSPRGKSNVSPRNLTKWKGSVIFQPSSEKPRGRPKKFKSDGDNPGKGFPGRTTIKFRGFNRKKFSATGGNFMKCPYCDYKSTSIGGVKKHCEWKHPKAKVQCGKCPFSTFIPEEMERHELHDLCKNETVGSGYLADKHERSKSPEKGPGRPRKSLSTTESSVVKTTSDIVDENGDENSNDDGVQLPCPHCDFVSHLFALKRHLFFYHKECDWKCKLCGYKSDSKKDVVRHSNRAHPNTQPNVVQTFADISNLLPDEASEQDTGTPPEKDIDENKFVSKHKLMGREYYMTSRKRLYLGKKRVGIANGQSTEDGKPLGIILPSIEKRKRGRKKESKVHDQNSFVVRPKKLKIAKIGFSCVYCTYAAPLRHQLRLHCYEKHTKHPACLMEFSNSIMALEEQECFGRDLTEDRRSPEHSTKDNKTITGRGNEDNKGDNCENSMEQDANSNAVKEDTKSSESNSELDQKTEISEKPGKSECCSADNQSSDSKDMESQGQETENKEDKAKMDEKIDNEKNMLKTESEQDKEVLSCMESILENIGSGVEAAVTKTDDETNNTLTGILPSSTPLNGHKFANPFSTLIVQLNSTQLKVKDAFEGTLDDVDVYLEKFGVRTLNMDSLTPRQFALFMKKFGGSLQQLSEQQV